VRLIDPNEVLLLTPVVPQGVVIETITALSMADRLLLAKLLENRHKDEDPPIHRTGIFRPRCKGALIS
jgi:hypothetical protein